MAITSSVLSTKRLSQVVSINATAANDTVTIPLTSTLISDQTSSSSISLAVNIAGAWASLVSGTATISRSGVTLLTLASNAVDRKSTRLNSSHIPLSRMPSSA